jgi:hypothetical protein
MKRVEQVAVVESYAWSGDLAEVHEAIMCDEGCFVVPVNATTVVTTNGDCEL